MNKAIIVVDLGFGDSGKGTVVDSLVRKYNSKLVVRYNGGHQCAHNVHTELGEAHTFAQFGSGTFAGAQTLLGPAVIVDPLAMQVEATSLTMNGVDKPFELMMVHHACLITTPYHKSLNVVRELSRNVRHGSTGVGIGETVRYAKEAQQSPLIARDLNNKPFLTEKLKKLKDDLHSKCLELIHDYQLIGIPIDLAMEAFTMPNSLSKLVDRYVDWANTVCIGTDWFSLLNQVKPVVFEGAQGVLLDQVYGFHPYTTWSDTTDRKARKMLDKDWDTECIGVMRTYMTRHGRGPLVTESNEGYFATRDDDNRYQRFQGTLREGYPDLVAWQYAIKSCEQVDSLALTHCDKLSNNLTKLVCTGYRDPAILFAEVDLLNYTPVEASPSAWAMTDRLMKAVPRLEAVSDLPALITKVLKKPIILRSAGKSEKAKIWDVEHIVQM